MLIGLMDFNTVKEYISCRRRFANKLYEGNIKLCAVRIVEDIHWIQLSKEFFSNGREMDHYNKFLKKHDLNIDVSVIESRGIMHVTIPLFWNENKDTKRISSSYNIHMYIEVKNGPEYVTSEVVQIDLTKFNIYEFDLNLSLILKNFTIKGAVFVLCIPKCYISRLLNERKSDYDKTFSEYPFKMYAKFKGSLSDCVVEPVTKSLYNIQEDIFIQHFSGVNSIVCCKLELFPFSSKSNIVTGSVYFKGDEKFSGYYFIGNGMVVISKSKYFLQHSSCQLSFPIDKLIIDKIDEKSASVNISYDFKTYFLDFDTAESAKTFLNICHESAIIKKKWSGNTVFYSKNFLFNSIYSRIKTINGDLSAFVDQNKTKTSSGKKLRN